MNEAAKRYANSFVAEIDPAELAVRLIERGCHMKRASGQTGQAAWADIEEAAAAGKVPQYIVRDFEAMALIAIAYFGECIDKMQQRN